MSKTAPFRSRPKRWRRSSARSAWRPTGGTTPSGSSTCCSPSPTSRRRGAILATLRRRPRRAAAAARRGAGQGVHAGAGADDGRAGADARLRSRHPAGDGARRGVEREARGQRQPARVHAAGGGEPRGVLPARAGRRAADAAARDLARRRRADARRAPAGRRAAGAAAAPIRSRRTPPISSRAPPQGRSIR